VDQAHPCARCDLCARLVLSAREVPERRPNDFFSVPKISVCFAISIFRKGPRGQNRPADVTGDAVHVIRIATGELHESTQTDDGKNKASVELGRKRDVARGGNLLSSNTA
jgi:hypothetical protein